MKITVNASVDLINVAAYEKAVRAEVTRVFMKAGQRFLLAAIPRIPIWTGMARGAFREAEDLFGKVTVDAQSGGYRIRGTRGGGQKITSRYLKGFYYYPPGGGRIPRTPQSGRQFATPSGQILKASLVNSRFGLSFKFGIDMTYVNYLDDKKWGGFRAGQQAFIDYVNANLVLPNPLNYVIRKTYKTQ